MKGEDGSVYIDERGWSSVVNIENYNDKKSKWEKIADWCKRMKLKKG